MAFEPHPSSDELEAYSLGRSSLADLEKIEEHLIICERCQNELTLTDQYIQSITNELTTGKLAIILCVLSLLGAVGVVTVTSYLGNLPVIEEGR